MLFSKRYFIFSTIVYVFPVPAPARIMHGPVVFLIEGCMDWFRRMGLKGLWD